MTRADLLLGHRVRVYSTIGSVLGEGKVLAVINEPSIIVFSDDGRREAWPASLPIEILAEPTEQEEPSVSTTQQEKALVNTLGLRQLEKLAENRGKIHWRALGRASGYVQRADEELDELAEAIADRQTPEQVWREAADVANFVAMAADHYEQDYHHARDAARVPMDTERCPVCGSTELVRLPSNWQELVEAGAVIAIVGCGNPWHYADLFPPQAE